MALATTARELSTNLIFMQLFCPLWKRTSSVAQREEAINTRNKHREGEGSKWTEKNTSAELKPKSVFSGTRTFPGNAAG